MRSVLSALALVAAFSNHAVAQEEKKPDYPAFKVSLAKSKVTLAQAISETQKNGEGAAGQRPLARG